VTRKLNVTVTNDGTAVATIYVVDDAGGFVLTTYDLQVDETHGIPLDDDNKYVSGMIRAANGDIFYQRDETHEGIENVAVYTFNGDWYVVDALDNIIDSSDD